MELTGVIKYIGDVKQISEKFTKRDLIITIDYDKEYPQDVMFQLTQTRTNLIDGYAYGNTIKVHFNFNGKMNKNSKGETTCFNNLNAWKIEGKKAYNNTPTTGNPASTPEPDFIPPGDDNGDLPF